MQLSRFVLDDADLELVIDMKAVYSMTRIESSNAFLCNLQSTIGIASWNAPTLLFTPAFTAAMRTTTAWSAKKLAARTYLQARIPCDIQRARANASSISLTCKCPACHGLTLFFLCA